MRKENFCSPILSVPSAWPGNNNTSTVERNTHLNHPERNPPRQCIYRGQSSEADALENTPGQDCEACGGKGWLFTNTGNDQLSRYEIQRCDACERYDSDMAALQAVVAAASRQP